MVLMQICIRSGAIVCPRVQVLDSDSGIALQAPGRQGMQGFVQRLTCGLAE